MNGYASILDKSSLLSHFPSDYKEQLAKHLRRVEYQRGEVIFEEDKPGDALYIVEQGVVGVFSVDKAMGLDFELARLREGDCFGEMSLLTEEPRSATCRAIEPTVCQVLGGQTFRTLINGSPQMAVLLCKVLAKRIHALNRNHGIQFKSLANFKLDPQVASLVPEALLAQHRFIPISFEGGALTIATPNPQNPPGFDAVRRLLRGVEIKAVIITQEDYAKFSAMLGKQPQTAPAANGARKHAIQFYIDGVEKENDSKPLQSGEDAVSAVNSILTEAIEHSASDVHIEPEREGTVVRYRVEGHLRKRESMIPRVLHKGVISRLKVISSLDISEKRLAQDGRFSVSLDGRDFDARLSTMPTKNGEKAVIRLLESSGEIAGLSRVIVAEKMYQALRKTIMQPYGVILITGPTGSGKTTTMYSMLMERKTSDINIVTVEDPIEYSLAGISQTQVNAGIGLGFPEILHTFLRQDPDVIFIGETRDSATARMALEAGLTGKLVLTSFHSNDTIGAIVRLQEMGCDPFTLSNVLNAIICQRLLRRLCPACSEPFEYPQHLKDLLVESDVFRKGQVPQMKKSRGCPSCNNTGFKGRIAVIEALIPNDAVRQAISSSASPGEIAAIAKESGAHVSFARYSSFLLANGITVPAEVLRMLPHPEDLSWKPDQPTRPDPPGSRPLTAPMPPDRLREAEV